MTTLALISDTHLPERLAAIPQDVFELLAGCDLVLHAGDVGDLGVLDDLSAIAPVIAVRGNDGGTESAEVLPLEQLLVVEGIRILLWHGHFEDRSDEVAWRNAAGWTDIFGRIAGRARARGASIVVTGHTHIPLSIEHEGILLVNPGALAPGNAFLIQTKRSVARLEIGTGDRPTVRHIDVDTGRAFDVSFDSNATFDEVAAEVHASLMAETLGGMRRELDRLYRSDPAFRATWLEQAHDVWRGARGPLSRDDVKTALESGGTDARAYASRLETSRSDAM